MNTNEITYTNILFETIKLIRFSLRRIQIHSLTYTILNLPIIPISVSRNNCLKISRIINKSRK